MNPVLVLCKNIFEVRRGATRRASVRIDRVIKFSLWQALRDDSHSAYVLPKVSGSEKLVRTCSTRLFSIQKENRLIQSHTVTIVSILYVALVPCKIGTTV